MTTADVAAKLVAHCRAGTEEQGLDELYASDAISIEAMAGPSGSAVSEGVEAIRGKHAWWAENFEVHGANVDGPYVNGDSFSVIFEIDATEKASGQRMPMKEVALYDVADGKIVRESFFMAPMPG